MFSSSHVSEPIDRAVTQVRHKISMLASEGIRAQSLLVCMVSDLDETLRDKIENKYHGIYPEGDILVLRFE